MLEKIFEKFQIVSPHPGTCTGQQWLSDPSGTLINSYSPVDGKHLGSIFQTPSCEYNSTLETAREAFIFWRNKPAPYRGEIIRQMGLRFRNYKDELATAICLEMGKSYQEALGEVQELIDICDFSTGLSRQLHGFTMHSERPGHRMYEQYHPLGVVGIITAFNFPVAVWAWNAMIAWVCGNVCVWKPSEKVPFCAILTQRIVSEVLVENDLPEGISNLINGGAEVGKWIAEDVRIPLVSATGSVPMGKSVASIVGARLGKSLLELGGNNAIIITPDADLELAIRAVAFGAVGTCGQRCTTTRRLIVHHSIYHDIITRLKAIYSQLIIGNPMDEKVHLGPMIDEEAVSKYFDTLQILKQDQNVEELIAGGYAFSSNAEDKDKSCYVKPAIYKVPGNIDIVKHETFAPILYIMTYKDIDEAIALQNDVPQGLSSAIITRNLLESERFLSREGSDCGIANVNIGTSGAEIGGAFGGEKETGGGRESGSDAWKAYMRRQTNTINYSENLPLAQGIRFDIQ
ncbi:MAG: aldehyde dehydrogenase family protein [Cyclobacteriaceae bacterium]|nr:aldehyde dehydrogenase family protein [Cyclobacteriaceae bacterium]